MRTTHVIKPRAPKGIAAPEMPHMQGTRQRFCTCALLEPSSSAVYAHPAAYCARSCSERASASSIRRFALRYVSSISAIWSSWRAVFALCETSTNVGVGTYAPSRHRSSQDNHPLVDIHAHAPLPARLPVFPTHLNTCPAPPKPEN